jgi:hypothetical protein
MRPLSDISSATCRRSNGAALLGVASLFKFLKPWNGGFGIPSIFSGAAVKKISILLSRHILDFGIPQKEQDLCLTYS